MKSGIDYFPLNVSLDEKWELIEAEFGLAGFAVVVKLFQRIYGQHGYYCEWTNEVALLFGKHCGLGGNAVSEIVKASVRRGIFDKDLFEKYQILTSAGIQKRYFDAVSRRKQIEIEKQYLLIEVTQFLKSDCIKWKNVNIYSKNDDISEQSKVKKSRVKESINSTDKHSLPERADNVNYKAIVDKFNAICVSLPKVIKLTDTRRRAIKSSYGTVKSAGGFEKLFTIVEQSDFLTGRKGNFFGCGFDWILKPSNLTKIIEGNYDNRGNKPSQKQTSFDLDEYEDLANSFVPVYGRDES